MQMRVLPPNRGTIEGMALPKQVTAACQHVTASMADPRAAACEECGSEVNLRACTDCGHVGCCESQHGHNTAHARASEHPVIVQMPVSERSFVWCYACNRYL
jgi:uncharacterized UBP type Zn finger protein